MVKKPSKSVIIVLGAVVLGGVIGGAGTYVLTRSSDKSSSANTEVASLGKEPEKPEFKDVPTASTDTTLPAGVLSPSDISAQAFKFVGKDVKVKGIVTQTQEGKYSLVGQDGERPVGLPLDFGKSNLNPKDYAAATSQSSEKPKDPSAVTVSGKIVETKNGSTSMFTLEVTSVEK